MHIAVFLPPAVCAGEFGKLLSVFGTARQLNIDDFELSAGDAVRVAERARSTQSIEDSGQLLTRTPADVADTTTMVRNSGNDGEG